MSINVPYRLRRPEQEQPRPYIARLRHLYGPPTLHPPSSACLAAATARSALHALTLPDRNCWLRVGGCGSHALLDLAGHGKESLLNVCGALCGGLEEWDAQAVCKLLCSCQSLHII
jgi:hypothetical protein